MSKNFTISYLSFCLIVAALIALIKAAMPVRLLNEIWFFYAFFAIATWIAYIIGSIGIKRGKEESVLFILGGITVKLLATMVVAFIYLYKNDVGKVLFISNFFILYFLFTAFEIYSLMSNLRAQKK